jgi:hypothetical protein
VCGAGVSLTAQLLRPREVLSFLESLATADLPFANPDGIGFVDSFGRGRQSLEFIITETFITI